MKNICSVRLRSKVDWVSFSVGSNKSSENHICCFSCFNAQHLRVAQKVKKQSVDYTSAKVKLIQSWRYKTLAVIKRHKSHLSFYLERPNWLCRLWHFLIFADV